MVDAAEAGANAVKFQHFLAKEIVSEAGFGALGGRLSHQAEWTKPVYEVYEDYELDREWTAALAELAAANGVDFMSTPYDHRAIAELTPLVPAFKIGSGDITWTELIAAACDSGKPILIATGASSLEDVRRAAAIPKERNLPYALLQCNTNYTGSIENFRHVNLRVLEAFAERWPEAVLGLSDHTPGHATVLGAVTLGARIVEKHFTDDCSRVGPDHGFAMDPSAWREMVNRTRELEAAMGDGVKRVEANEVDTAVVQRRSLCARRDLELGAVLGPDDLKPLRPSPEGSFPPYREAELIGRELARGVQQGAPILSDDLRVTR